MNPPSKEKQRIKMRTMTTRAAALTLAAFAFLGMAAISAISMLSPMQQATAQESTPTCVKVHGGETQVGEPPQNGGPPQVFHLSPGEKVIGGEVLPNKACAELR